MIHWSTQEQPTIVADNEYDCEGVFTGCMVPCNSKNKDADEELTCAYTSVSELPIHYTLPYKRGCESLSLAKSKNGGRMWTKLKATPILPGPPEDLDVTGWRDPFIAPWPQMCRLIGLNEVDTLFGIISGGVRDVTPTSFVYAIDRGDLTKWQYLGPLVNIGLNQRLSRWSGDLGKNWEVTNFVTLSDETDISRSRDFLLMGAEGCVPDSASTTHQPISRPARQQLWMSGSIQHASQEDDSITGPLKMSYSFGGHLDHGCLYAANSFFDPLSQRPVVWGWITEDDLCDELRHTQEWSGMLSMPRELRIQTLRHVVGASASKLEDITSIEREEDDEGSHTVRTLASQPLQRLIEALRKGPWVRRKHLGQEVLGPRQHSEASTEIEIQAKSWELECSFRVSRGCCKVGVIIAHSEDGTQATSLTFNPRSETFTVERPSFPSAESSELINSAPENAAHTLFTFHDPKDECEKRETLDIRAWRDNSVLEVFVNGRTAISTRLYAAEQTHGMRFFAEDILEDSRSLDRNSDDVTSLEYATVWDDINIE